MRNLKETRSLYTSFIKQSADNKKAESQDEIQGEWKPRRGELWDQWREVIGTLPDYDRWFSLYPVMAEEEDLLSPEGTQEELSWEKKKKEFGNDARLRNLLISISSSATSARKLRDSVKLLKVLEFFKLWQQPISISPELSGKLSVVFAPSDDWKKRTESLKDAAKLLTNTRFVIGSLVGLKEHYQNFRKSYEQGPSKDCFVPVAYATTLEGKRFTLPQSSLRDFRSLHLEQGLKAHSDNKQALLSFILHGDERRYCYRDVNIGEEFGFTS
jgi:hypothetical protein